MPIAGNSIESFYTKQSNPLCSSEKWFRHIHNLKCYISFFHNFGKLLKGVKVQKK